MTKDLPLRTLGVVLYLIASIVPGFILFLGRESILLAGLILTSNAYLPRFLDKVYLVFFGLIWLTAWVLLEGYFSDGVKKRTHWRRFFKVMGIELILLFASSILLPFYHKSGVVNWLAVTLSIVSLAAGVILLILSRRSFSTQVKA